MQSYHEAENELIVELEYLSEGDGIARGQKTELLRRHRRHIITANDKR